MQYARDLRPRRQPSGEIEALTLGFAQPQFQRAQPAQREKNILWTGTIGEEIESRAQPFQPALV